METLIYLVGMVVLIGALGIMIYKWQQAQETIQQLQAQKADLETAKARLEEQKQHLEGQKASTNQMHKQFQEEFEKLAKEVLKQNSEEMTKNNKETLQNLLNPVKEKLTEFQNKVESTHEKQMRDQSALREHLQQLKSMNEQLGKEAESLANALKGHNKQQGHWGEMVLERVLEMAGLQKDREYILQSKDVSLTTETGRRQYPDVVVYLPDQKHVIIDAKVSLSAYERMVNSEDQQETQTHFQQHVSSIRQHISNLSSKHYEKAGQLNTPDFVLLFLPLEATFSTLINHQNQLLEEAWQKNIVIVSPTTLLATLKTIHSIWRYEYQNQNAEEIARLGGSMYDQLVGFVEEMQKIRQSIDQTGRHFDDAMKKLSEGRQSVTRKAEKLKKLGADSKKDLPGDFKDNELKG